MTSRNIFPLAVALIASQVGLLSQAQNFNPQKVLRKPMPTITDAPFLSVQKADSTVVRDEELVLGVVHKGQARAYPINQLTGPRREIVNDRLGGDPIAATW